MKVLKLCSCSLLALLIAIFTRESRGQALGGATTIRIHGSADNSISLPYQRPPEDSGQLSAAGTNSLRVSGKNWAPEQFVYHTDVQPKTYYAFIANGELEGLFYKILANDADTLILDTEGDDLTSHPLGKIAFGDTVKIVPYWTIASVFGATAADLIIDPRTSPVFAKDDILLYGDNSTAINKPPSRTIYYRAGHGWRSVDDPGTSSADTILPPGSVFVVRRRNPAPIDLVNSGLYHTQRRVLFIQGGDGKSGNDQHISLAFPEPVSLNESNLAGTVVKPSRSPLFRNDELFFSRGLEPGINTPPNTTVYFRDKVGWEMIGDLTPIGNSFFIQPGEGIIIRKKAGNPGTDWQQLPPQ